jgi:hypothetical protein
VAVGDSISGRYTFDPNLATSAPNVDGLMEHQGAALHAELQLGDVRITFHQPDSTIYIRNDEPWPLLGDFYQIMITDSDPSLEIVGLPSTSGGAALAVTLHDEDGSWFADESIPTSLPLLTNLESAQVIFAIEMADRRRFMLGGTLDTLSAIPEPTAGVVFLVGFAVIASRRRANPRRVP